MTHDANKRFYGLEVKLDRRTRSTSSQEDSPPSQSLTPEQMLEGPRDVNTAWIGPGGSKAIKHAQQSYEVAAMPIYLRSPASLWMRRRKPPVYLARFILLVSVRSPTSLDHELCELFSAIRMAYSITEAIDLSVHYALVGGRRTDSSSVTARGREVSRAGGRPSVAQGKEKHRPGQGVSQIDRGFE